jgi:hypothetical protein
VSQKGFDSGQCGSWGANGWAEAGARVVPEGGSAHASSWVSGAGGATGRPDEAAGGVARATGSGATGVGDPPLHAAAATSMNGASLRVRPDILPGSVMFGSQLTPP